MFGFLSAWDLYLSPKFMSKHRTKHYLEMITDGVNIFSSLAFLYSYINKKMLIAKVRQPNIYWSRMYCHGANNGGTTFKKKGNLLSLFVPGLVQTVIVIIE